MRIKGRVQGVFFRASTKDTAERLGLKGWVKNLPDGTVEAVAEGNEDVIQEFINWCRRGPEHANVTDIDLDWQAATGKFENFTIE